MNIHGTLVKGPKAPCELQGYVGDAWLRMAQVYDALDRPSRAKDLRAKAAVLFEKFDATFWSESSGYHAFALDGDKQPVWSAASKRAADATAFAVIRGPRERVHRRPMTEWSRELTGCA
jgi:glycogen debranching enzyme